MSEAWVVHAGLVPYEPARQAQKALEGARQAGDVPDVLLLLEHPPVYTKGRRTEAAELPMGEDWYRMQGIEVTETDRGGRVTYHGPGQLVGYPIVDLANYGSDVHMFVRRLEEVMVTSLAEYGIEARCIQGLTGVWVEDRPAGTGSEAEDFGGIGSRKIGSIGVHVNRGVTTHGFAVNVSNDLQPFEWIVPCGIDDCRMTSVTRELGSEVAVEAFAATARERYAAVYERDPVDVPVAELVARVPAAAPLQAERAAALR
jgi:lipoyl(octanoyl) transferase